MMDWMTRWIVLGLLALIAFGAGVLYSTQGHAAEPVTRVRKETSVDFEGMRIQGELRTPGEFYFERKNEENFDSLVQRKKNFHREMRRDALRTR